MIPDASSGRNDVQSLTRHGRLSMLAIVGLCGGLIAWAAMTQISGAIIAPGTLMVQDNAKRVQHPEGGIVAQLLVRNEDVVTGGQLLAVLDQTAIAANLAISEAQLLEAFAREARILSEIGEQSSITASDTALALFSPTELAPLIELEQQVKAARQATQMGRIGQLEEQITQLDRQRGGLIIQKDSIEDLIAILKTEIADFDALYANQLIAVSRGTALRKEIASTTGQLGQVVASIAEILAASAERALQIEQIRDEFLTTALAELQEARSVIAEVSQRRVADRDRLARTEIRAPQAGTVHESTLHTIGGVAAPGETLMLIVPGDEPLLVNVRVSPIDIDKVVVGQEVVLRLPGLNPRTTPELFATIARVAPDATLDPATGVQYYSARITISDNELSRLPDGTRLVPGMPVESYVQLQDRTVLSYLVQPFADQLRGALREE